jgi:hypothetical protein
MITTIRKSISILITKIKDVYESLSDLPDFNKLNKIILGPRKTNRNINTNLPFILELHRIQKCFAI